MYSNIVPNWHHVLWCAYVPVRLLDVAVHGKQLQDVFDMGDVHRIMNGKGDAACFSAFGGGARLKFESVGTLFDDSSLLTVVIVFCLSAVQYPRYIINLSGHFHC